MRLRVQPSGQTTDSHPSPLALLFPHWAWDGVAFKDFNELSHLNSNTHSLTVFSLFCITNGRIMNESECCSMLVCARAELHMWVKYVLVLRSHVLPDSMVTNPSLLPIFPLYLVSSGRDYTGLDNLPEADMHSFIKNPNADAHTSPIQPKCTN